MAKIVVNDTKEIKGKITAIKEAGEDGNITVSGGLLTHRYFEDINKLETERFILEGVEVLSEEFASNEFYISYQFTADSLSIKGIDENCETNLPEDVIEKIEEELFKEEENELFHEEVYKKWKSEMN